MQNNFGTSFHNTTFISNFPSPVNQRPANHHCKYGSRKVSIHNAYEGSLIQPSSPQEQHEMFDGHLERIEWDFKWNFKREINDVYSRKTANQRASISEQTDLVHVVREQDREPSRESSPVTSRVSDLGPVSTWFWDQSMNVSCKQSAAPELACRENQSIGFCETLDGHLDGPSNKCAVVQTFGGAFGSKFQQTERTACINSVFGEGNFSPGSYCSWPLGEKCNQVSNLSSDIARKPGDISSKGYLIKQWAELESYGNKQNQGSPEWETAWRKAYEFASQCAEIDYHFNLNMAKSLTKGKQLNLAKTILLGQLGKYYEDPNYISAVNKQLGFICFLEDDFFYSLKYYMDGYSIDKIVPDKVYSFIRISMNRIKQECIDDLFKNTAIRWFSKLVPKKKASNAAVLNVMVPMTYSSPCFPVMSETGLKWPGSGMDESLVDQWKNLERIAYNYVPGTIRWKEAWGCARDFALQCVKADYHFNLNAAIALTKLNHLEQAVNILLKQLSEAESKHDQAYLAGVNKQLGFIYYRKKSYAESVYYYMQCIDSSRAVPDKIYKFISISMEALMEGKFPCLSFRDSALKWYLQIYPQSREDIE